MSPITAELDMTLLALADATRRAILQRVSLSEVRVTEVAKPFAMSLNAISKHIRVLEAAGLVKRRREGREHWISIEPKPLDDAAEWIEQRRMEWTARLDALEVALQERRNQGQRP